MENEIALPSADVIVEYKNAVPAKKRLTVLGVEFVYLYLMGIGFAMLGWVVENGYRIATKGIIDCRYHLLPFISSYALIPFCYHVLLGDPNRIAFFGRRLFARDNTKTRVLSNVLCIVFICSAVFLAEIVWGNMWEALFGVRLWNYSKQPFHVTRYAGLVSTVGFGVGTYAIFRFSYKPLLKLIRQKVKFKVAKVICRTLGVIIWIDSAIMAIQIAVLRRAPMYWLVHLW